MNVEVRPPGPASRSLPTHAARRVLRSAAVTASRALPRPDVATRRVILCYHSVHPSVPYASASPGLFAEHLDWLRANTDVVDLPALLDSPAALEQTRPRVSLTFDDGYVDNYEYAFPLLAARGMPAAFFLTAGFLERDEAVMQRLAVIWRTPCAALAPLAWSQVVEMQAAGMTVGSHTWSHPNLSQLPVLVAKHELTRSKDVIEQRTGAAVDALAYPFGKWGEHVDATTLRLAEVAGYEVGYASSPRAVAARDGRFRVPRFGVGDDSVADVAAKVRGEIDWHTTVHDHLPRRVRRALFPVYP